MKSYILNLKITEEVLKRHVSEENKMIQLIQPKSWGGETPPQQNDTKNDGKHWGGETPPQQNNIRGPETGRQQNGTKVYP